MFSHTTTYPDTARVYKFTNKLDAAQFCFLFGERAVSAYLAGKYIYTLVYV